MPEVIQGDNWKNGDCGYAAEKPTRKPILRQTREQQQAQVDTLYGKGEILLEDWRSETDRIGNCAHDGHPY